MLYVKIDLSSDEANLFDKEANKMNTFIHTHGARQIGPLIQYSNIEINGENEADINMQFMLQAENFRVAIILTDNRLPFLFSESANTA